MNNVSNLSINFSTLQKIWQNEKFSKELLKFENNYITQILIEIEKREEVLNKSREDESDILELDIERAKYILKDYLRIRLAKIEKYLFYIIKNEMNHLLSNQEFNFACDLFKLKKNFFNENFIKKVNPSLNDFKPVELGEDIIVTPSDSYVIAKNTSLEPIILNLKDVSESIDIKTMYRDDIYCVPFKLIR